MEISPDPEAITPDSILDAQGNTVWTTNQPCGAPRATPNPLVKEPILGYYLEKRSMRPEVDRQDKVMVLALGGLAVAGEAIGLIAQSKDLQVDSAAIFIAGVVGLGFKRLRRWHEDRRLRSKKLI